MTLSIEQLNREIHGLETKTEILVAEIQEAYQDYLDRLGETIKRQLIAACYHLATQSFPDAFLKLSYNEREQLQRSLHALAQDTKTQLNLKELGKMVLAEPELESDFDELEEEDSAESNFQRHFPDLALEIRQSRNDREPNDREEESSNSAIESDVAPTSSTELDLDPSTPPSLKNPQILLDWYSEIEEAIVEVLRQTSHRATHLLERAHIIHNQLPEPLMEAATQSEAAENVGGPPNILNLVVEMGKINDEGRKSATQRIQIVAVYLRLSELEFTDTHLVSQRNKLRSLLHQLKSLSKGFNKRSREYAIAQAEAAWRSSWSNGG